MAAPMTVTLKNLQGRYNVNKTQSDPFDDTLQLQGIGWLARKAISVASISLAIKQYIGDDGLEHIDIDQFATGGIKTTELRIFDDVSREHKDMLFGLVQGRNRRIKLSSLSDEDPDEAYLKAGWSQDIVDDDEIIDGIVISEANGWEGRLVWGFAIVDGERKYVRRSVVKKGKQTKRNNMVYDYVGPL
ncbi:uncharacterized protein PV09_08654 [Verruconis gallopava]|uniref:Uncharacterized protein n=1 Tax=Verruconis gallopava TaxID=253628 RepID=A0A0D2A078_9PEZI|nr:uncharacterized protein PV09_08654 [Verruconis gallopava]KIV99724.1 hypothetical protein PV09_08654 [Verruconis gallopava]